MSEDGNARTQGAAPTDSSASLQRVPWVKPKKQDVASAHIYTGAYGFRYSLRNAEGKVIYEAPHAFRSRYHAIEQIKQRYGLPISKISTEVG